jgi:hypothetical protein
MPELRASSDLKIDFDDAGQQILGLGERRLGLALAKVPRRHVGFGAQRFQDRDQVVGDVPMILGCSRGMEVTPHLGDIDVDRRPACRSARRHRIHEIAAQGASSHPSSSSCTGPKSSLTIVRRAAQVAYPPCVPQ